MRKKHTYSRWSENDPRCTYCGKPKDDKIHNEINFEPEKREKKPLTAKEIKLLDEFAGQQAAVLIKVIHMWNVDKYKAQTKEWAEMYGTNTIKELIAKDSYNMAQALLKERKNHL